MGLTPPLMPHQEAGVIALEKAGGRLLLADDMGLGKTRTVLEYLRRNKINAIVVTTKSFLYGWKAEAARWYPEASVSIIAKKSDKCDILDALIITTYDVLWRKDAFIRTECVIFDESHKLAGGDSKRSIAARKLVEGKAQVICMTGTPQPAGQPRQLWHQLLLVFPRFMKWSEFARRFCAPTQVWAGWAGRMVWDYSGSSNEEELRALIAPRFLRRTKEVLCLPRLSIEDIPVFVKTARRRDEEWGAYAQRLALDKVKHTITLVDDIMERGDKVLVFTSFRSVRDQLFTTFEYKATLITAEMSATTRALQVKRFQEDSNCKLFIATTQIAAEGLTLTAANIVIFNDLPFTPGALAQAQARAHRAGQTKSVHVYYVQSNTKFDTVVKETLTSRQAVTESLLDRELKK